MNAKTVELHLIQSFPPSCVNRDGNNSPKDCTFGGARRARISSQCFKRAIRQADIFEETVGEAIGIRSKRMRDEVLIPYLLEKGLDEKSAEEKADAFRKALAKDDSKHKNLTSVGLYFSKEELVALLEAHMAGEKKLSQVARPRSTDVSLFGRMLAEAPDLNVDAATQVAHAISTHKLSQELDYWTAADDLKDNAEGDDAGASMLGTAEFNASVFYRYACLNVPQLLDNLQGERELACRTVKGFLLASYDAMPTGKLNGHANFVWPRFALAVVRRRGMPMNLANAFLAPVPSHKPADLERDSADALLKHLERMRKMVPVDEATYLSTDAFAEPLAPSGIVRAEGYAALVEKVMEELQCGAS